MTLYHQQDGIKIYCGDCAEVLPSLQPVDLVLTDPPYGIGEAAGKNKSRTKAAKAKDYGVSHWDDAPVDIALIDVVIAKGRYAAIFGGNYYSLPPASCWLVWDKENSGDFADAELAWTNYGTAVRLKRHMWNGMLRKGREPRYHPTQKPLDVMKWAISKCPSKPRTILDPFMGVGTTLRAAKDLGIEAIGIEREERYCEIAVKRLAQGVLPL
jgi:DNA modification methylase